MLLYVPKRIHFGSQTFKMRMNLAVLDWVSPLYFRLPMLTIIIVSVNFYFQNENVQRGHTSERMYIDMRRPNRRTPLRVLVDKTFRFVRMSGLCT